MISADKILDAAAATYRERNPMYGSNYLNVGEAMKGFFPNGIELKTANDHVRFHLFCWLVGKLSRYANQWEKGHQDSIHDAIVYAAMLEANPPENSNVVAKKENAKRSSSTARKRTNIGRAGGRRNSVS